jgi:hypothetical protein
MDGLVDVNASTSLSRSRQIGFSKALALVLTAKAPRYEIRILRKSFRREAGFIGGWRQDQVALRVMPSQAALGNSIEGLKT